MMKKNLFVALLVVLASANTPVLAEETAPDAFTGIPELDREKRMAEEIFNAILMVKRSC